VASLYKKPIVVTDPKTGEKVKKKSRKWWGRYRDAMGREKRVPLAGDKAAAQAMLNDLVRRVELERAGRLDPFEEHLKRPFTEHIDEFEQHLKDKGNSAQHVFEVAARVRKIARGCKWKSISDISASEVQRYLGARRDKGLGRQTSNHYLRAIKQFSRWLVRDRRYHDDPLIHVAMLNVKVDRRHDRRALSDEEFALLVEAAMEGKRVVKISGPDRAIMYILSAWTGYRRSELGSLTKRSLRLDDDPPTITVAAAYSKRKRQDTQVLHRVVVERLREWLEDKRALAADALLFPVSAKIPGGVDRRTSKMMRADLKAARKKWIAAAKTPEEKAEREQSDFHKYQNDLGLFADFHSNRHTFITNLEHVGVTPGKAQSLARHCDIRLTMGVYTHIGLNDQKTAIELLPPPPVLRPSKKAPPSNGQAGGNGADPANGQVLHKQQLDALWAQLPEQVKTALLASVQVNPENGKGGQRS